MIDTVCLLIPSDKAIFIDLSNTGVPKWSLQANTSYYQKFVKNPSKADKESGYYYPRLTGYRRSDKFNENIRIEFSVPKLLYQNNLDEVEDKDFEKVVETLQKRLKAMGVEISKGVLKTASVSSVHYSKNIQLTDGYTASHVISEINKVNLNKRFDFARAKFSNEGESLYAHTSSHQLVIYDKIADLNKPTKRAVDKDQTPQQLGLFTDVKKQGMLEVIRFEVRLSRKQKLNKVFVNLGYSKNPDFRYVFCEEKSKAIISHYWETLVKGSSIGLFGIPLSNKDLLRKVITSNPKVGAKNSLYLSALVLFAKDGGGIREFRSIIERHYSSRTWYRIVSDLKKVSISLSDNELRSWVVQIENSLEEYKVFKYISLLTDRDL